MLATSECLAVRTATQSELRYLLYRPETPGLDASPLPLVLFLHGMGERGDQLSAVKRHGPPARIENGAEFPFIVAAPQCAPGAVWQNESLASLLDALSEGGAVDPRRIYLTGLSMGGAGAWALGNACPGRFAAIAPICGPYTMLDPINFRDMPVWCFHGAMDDVVPVTDSIRLVNRLRAHGARVRFTVDPDAGHDSWTQAYAGNELYDWLLSHTLV